MKKEIMFWGDKWQKEDLGDLNLLTLPNQSKAYYEKARNYYELFSWARSKINSLKFFTVKPTCNIAVFPEEIFLEKTKIPFSWGTICVRSTNGRKSDVLCCKYSKNSKLTKINQLNAKYQTGLIHELNHLFFSQQLDHKSSIGALNEGFCEFIPRILLNLQKEMPNSTQYLTSLNKKDIVTFKDFDKYGPSHFSSETISKNPAYASAFLGVMWLAKKFSKNQTKPDYLKGGQNLIKFLFKYHEPSEAYQALANKTKLKNFRDSKIPMLEAIKYLKGLYKK